MKADAPKSMASMGKCSKNVRRSNCMTKLLSGSARRRGTEGRDHLDLAHDVGVELLQLLRRDPVLLVPGRAHGLHRIPLQVFRLHLEASDVSHPRVAHVPLARDLG